MLLCCFWMIHYRPSMHTSASTFFSGHLRVGQGRYGVLAMHQLHILSRCVRIFWMVDGRTAACGRLAELVRVNAAFAEFLGQAGEKGRMPVVVKESQDVQESAPVAPKDKTAPKLMQDDIKAVNSVPWPVYMAWMRSSVSLLNMILVIALLCAFRAANYLTSLSLAWGVSDMQGLTTEQYVRITLVRDNRIVLTFIRLVWMLGRELHKPVSCLLFGSCLCRRHSC